MNTCARIPKTAIDQNCFPPSTAASRSISAFRSAFTLVELLVVVAIMGLLMTLALPAFNAINGAGSLTKGASDMQGFLEQARSMAMAQNTYVYVGVQEVDALSGTTNASGPSYGRVVVAAVASLNGTRPVVNNNPGITNTNVTAVSKALTFDNIHITNVGSVTNASATMVHRPNSNSVANFVDFSTVSNGLSFNWPIGAANTKYSFKQVIEFDPQGIPRIQTNSTYSSSVEGYIEIPLVMTHGNQVMSNSINQAAIQIDGITGAVRLYRP